MDLDREKIGELYKRSSDIIKDYFELRNEALPMLVMNTGTFNLEYGWTNNDTMASIFTTIGYDTIEDDKYFITYPMISLYIENIEKYFNTCQIDYKYEILESLLLDAFIHELIHFVQSKNKKYFHEWVVGKHDVYSKEYEGEFINQIEINCFEIISDIKKKYKLNSKIDDIVHVMYSLVVDHCYKGKDFDREKNMLLINKLNSIGGN